MKRMKKIFAMLLAFTMILGMTMTASAETKNSAEIKVVDSVNGVESDTVASLEYVHVIKPDTKTATGWVFTSDAIAEDYTSALGAADAQTAIAMLIKYANSTLPEGAPSIIKNATAATAVQINQALDNVINGVTLNAMSNPQTVTEAGVYAIKAVEDGYTYKAMSAYVGFNTVTVNGATYDYPSLEDEKVITKKIPTVVTKADNDVNNAVAINQTVTYTVTTAFPYFNQNDTNKEFKVWDKIKGASYTGLADDETTAEVNEMTATVTIGTEVVSEEVTFAEETLANDEDGFEKKFTVDLSGYIDDANSNAGKTVTVNYQAVVNAVEVVNGAGSRIGGKDIESNEINLYTGKITLTKVDADNNEIKLENAGFNVTKSGETALLTFVQKDTTKKVYTYDPAGTITEVFTDANGEVVVEGLDIGAYVFAEKTAPTGYSINETPKSIELDINDEGESVDGEAVKIFADVDSIADTKLIALPSTGGIGTTIFTVAGCGIMIAAAFFFFASRKKEN